MRAAPLALVLGTIGLTACGSEQEARPPVHFAPPAFESLRDPGWSPSTGPDDPVVATVGEAEIHRSTVERQLELTEGMTPRQVLDRLIETEVLAQKALERGLQNDPAVLNSLKHNVVRELLNARFVERDPASAITEKDYEKAYYYPNVRIKFDHEDGYFVVDAQIACCQGSAEECKKGADPACFDQMTPVIQSVYEEIRKGAPYADAESIRKAVSSVQDGYPMLSQTDIQFWYEQGVPYAKQDKYTTYSAAWVDAVLAIPRIGEVAPPVRTDFGWHVPILYDHIPAEHRTLGDPGVRQEIAKNIYPAIRRRDYRALIGELAKEIGEQRFYDALEKAEESRRKPGETP